MVLVNQLSLLGSSDDCIINNALSSTSGNWTWEIECNNQKYFTLEATGQTLNQCVPKSSSETCLDINYKSKCVRLCLKDENGSIMPSCVLENSCDGESAKIMTVTVSSQVITFIPRKIFLPTLDSLNHKVKIKFKCTQNTASLCPPNDSSTSLKLYKESKSWIDALDHCQKENSSLVEITNQTNNNALNVLWQYERELQRGVWIGLERSVFGYKSEWKWISGSKVEYCQWNSSQPVNALNYHCGRLILINESKEIKWLDADCHEELPFICQSLNKMPCLNNVTTLLAELCIEHQGSLDYNSCGDECKKCCNNPAGGAVSNMNQECSEYLCIDFCPP